jgi:hypothetical protein
MKLPHNWKPREYQKDAYNAWIKGSCKHLELIWHRRAGKDSLCLHGTMVKMWQRPANYWHMLPLSNQVRKAIWKAVNPHTGKRWIDEAFPIELRVSTNDTEMLITFINGSTWQCLGSDNYLSAIGSAPAGIVFSEWSLSNPQASGYLRPILAENGGWQVKIGTPRGENHAYRTYNAALTDNNQFAQLLTVNDTRMDRVWDMEYELKQYIVEFGEDMGTALFNQEYYCSFKAAIFGAIYGKELTALDNEGRIGNAPHIEGHKVFTSWDIGRTDSTAIFFFQVINNKVRVIDYEESTLETPDYFFSRILGYKITVNIVDGEIQVLKGKTLEGFEHRKEYDYETHWLPHDAKAKTFSAMGKSLQDQAHAVFTWDKVSITPSLSIQDGIKAARQLLRTIVIDDKARQGYDALKEYVYKYDEKNKVLSVSPLHNWASNAADAFRYMAIAYETPRKEQPKPHKPQVNDIGIVMADYIQPTSNPEW